MSKYASSYTKIGVVGFSREEFDQEEAKRLLREILARLAKGKAREKVELVSGLTNMGVPKLAYHIAVELGFRTVGFSAKQALRAGCGVYPVDRKMIRGRKYGEESQEFIEYIDVLVRIGGGVQSRREVELFKEKHVGETLEGILVEEEVAWLGEPF